MFDVFKSLGFKMQGKLDIAKSSVMCCQGGIAGRISGR